MTLLGPVRRANDALPPGTNLRLRIGEHIVDTGTLRLTTRPELPRLTSKAVAVLIELVREAGRTVTRDQLLERVWTGRFPTPDVLTQAIKELRRAFADDSKPSRYIETIPKLGYRLIASVLVLDEDAAAVAFEAVLPSLAGAGDVIVANDDAAIVEVGSPRARPSPAARMLMSTAISGALLAAALLGLGRLYNSHAAEAPARAWKVSDARALTSDLGAERGPSLSPDGTRIAFTAAAPGSKLARVVVRAMEPSQLVRISTSGLASEALPVWSPDGTRIAFERERNEGCAIFVASSLGGGEREVGSCSDAAVHTFDWTPDGRGLVTAQSRGRDRAGLALARLDLDTGAKTFLDGARGAGEEDREPHYSPDGRFLAFRRGIEPYSDLYVMPADGGDARQVTHIASRIRGHTWTRDGRALVFASDFAGATALYAVDIASGQLQALGVSPAEYPHAARDADTVAYEIPRAHHHLTLVSLDGSTRRTLAPSTGSDYAAALSPAGDRLAFISDRSGQYQLWLYDSATDSATQLTEQPERPVFEPRWSARGDAIVAVQLDPAAGRQLIEIDVASRRRRVLSRPGENVLFGEYGADPDSYLFAFGASGKNNQLVLVRRPGQPDESRERIATGVAFAQVDAAAHEVYYTTSAGDGLYRRDPGGGDTRLVSPNVSSGTSDGWRVVDGHIWYVSGADAKPVVLHDLDPATGAERDRARIDVALSDVNFSVAADRTALVVSEIGAEDTDIGLFTLTRAIVR